MITDITGTTLTPGNSGKDCPGNGEYADIECCCDECDYTLCCLDTQDDGDCLRCTDQLCPHSPNHTT